MDPNRATATNDHGSLEEEEARLMTRNIKGDEFYGYLDKFLRLIEEFETMWGGHLGRFSIVKH